MSPVLPPRPSRRRRLRVPRRPALFWPSAITLALLTGLLVSRLSAVAASEVARYGEPEPAVVVVRPVEAGTRLTAADTEIRRLPGSVVPTGARRSSVVGEIALVDLHDGEVVVASRLAPAGLSPTAALLPAGTRGVSVPTGPGIGLHQGDLVDVLATIDPTLTADGAGDADGGAPTFPVARSALVVATDTDAEAVTLAVSQHDAPRVAFALSAGTVTLLLVGVDD